jgi:flavin reductase (DIM6/NTAB) family NADH-FMN oxidoreductase RutF
MKIDPAKLDFSESHDFLAEALSPRLVILVSTIGEDDVFNVAPFASTGIMCYKPPIVYVGISSRKGEKKDTLRNIEWSGDFVFNLCDEAMAEAMNKTAVDHPADVDEFKVSGLTPVAGEKVRSPRVKESPLSLECKVTQILQFGRTPALRHAVLGEAVLAHVNDGLYAEGKMDPWKKNAIAHVGGGLYCRTTDIFELRRL